MANSRGAKTGIKAAFQKPPPATMKYMPEQPLTGAIRFPINKINRPRYTSHGISPQISNNCVNKFPLYYLNS